MKVYQTSQDNGEDRLFSNFYLLASRIGLCEHHSCPSLVRKNTGSGNFKNNLFSYGLQNRIMKNIVSLVSSVAFFTDIRTVAEMQKK